MTSQIPPAPPMSSNYHSSASIEGGGYVPEQKAKQSSFQLISLNIVQNFTQFCLGGAVISALISTIFYNSSQHTVLCTVGYFILMAQAILCFSPVGWANNMKYETQRILHSLMQILGAVLAIAGCSVIFADNRFSFLADSHSICGFVALILTILHLISGVFSLIYYNKLNKLVKVLHLCLGTAIMIVAFIALILAFHIYIFLMDLSNAIFPIVITVFALIGIIMISFVNYLVLTRSI